MQGECNGCVPSKNTNVSTCVVETKLLLKTRKWTFRITTKDTTREEKKKQLLHSMFYDVSQPSAYTGKDNVFRTARAVLSSITRADVDRWFEEQLAYTLHKPACVRFARNKTIVKSIDDQWQAD